MTTDPDSPFLRVRPCADCPFRCAPSPRAKAPGGLFVGLRPDRVEEIADSLSRGEMFPCHQSVHGSRPVGEHWCAGALSIILTTGEAWANMGTRFAAMTGMFDPKNFEPCRADVYPDLPTWVAALTQRYEETR